MGLLWSMIWPILTKPVEETKVSIKNCNGDKLSEIRCGQNGIQNLKITLPVIKLDEDTYQRYVYLPNRASLERIKKSPRKIAKKNGDRTETQTDKKDQVNNGRVTPPHLWRYCKYHAANYRDKDDKRINEGYPHYGRKLTPPRDPNIKDPNDQVYNVKDPDNKDSKDKGPKDKSPNGKGSNDEDISDEIPADSALARNLEYFEQMQSEPLEKRYRIKKICDRIAGISDETDEILTTETFNNSKLNASGSPEVPNWAFEKTNNSPKRNYYFDTLGIQRNKDMIDLIWSNPAGRLNRSPELKPMAFNSEQLPTKPEISSSVAKEPEELTRNRNDALLEIMAEKMKISKGLKTEPFKTASNSEQLAAKPEISSSVAKEAEKVTRIRNEPLLEIIAEKMKISKTEPFNTASNSEQLPTNEERLSSVAKKSDRITRIRRIHALIDQKLKKSTGSKPEPLEAEQINLDKRQFWVWTDKKLAPKAQEPTSADPLPNNPYDFITLDEKLEQQQEQIKFMWQTRSYSNPIICSIKATSEEKLDFNDKKDLGKMLVNLQEIASATIAAFVEMRKIRKLNPSLLSSEVSSNAIQVDYYLERIKKNIVQKHTIIQQYKQMLNSKLSPEERETTPGSTLLGTLQRIMEETDNDNLELMALLKKSAPTISVAKSIEGALSKSKQSSEEENQAMSSAPFMWWDESNFADIRNYCEESDKAKPIEPKSSNELVANELFNADCSVLTECPRKSYSAELFSTNTKSDSIPAFAADIGIRKRPTRETKSESEGYKALPWIEAPLNVWKKLDVPVFRSDSENQDIENPMRQALPDRKLSTEQEIEVSLELSPSDTERCVSSCSRAQIETTSQQQVSPLNESVKDGSSEKENLSKQQQKKLSLETEEVITSPKKLASNSLSNKSITSLPEKKNLVDCQQQPSASEQLIEQLEEDTKVSLEQSVNDSITGISNERPSITTASTLLLPKVVKVAPIEETETECLEKSSEAIDNDTISDKILSSPSNMGNFSDDLQKSPPTKTPRTEKIKIFPVLSENLNMQSELVDILPEMTLLDSSVEDIMPSPLYKQKVITPQQKLSTLEQLRGAEEIEVLPEQSVNDSITGIGNERPSITTASTLLLPKVVKVAPIEETETECLEKSSEAIDNDIISDKILSSPSNMGNFSDDLQKSPPKETPLTEKILPALRNNENMQSEVVDVLEDITVSDSSVEDNISSSLETQSVIKHQQQLPTIENLRGAEEIEVLPEQLVANSAAGITEENPSTTSTTAQWQVVSESEEVETSSELSSHDPAAEGVLVEPVFDKRQKILEKQRERKVTQVPKKKQNEFKKYVNDLFTLVKSGFKEAKESQNKLTFRSSYITSIKNIYDSDVSDELKDARLAILKEVLFEHHARARMNKIPENKRTLKELTSELEEIESCIPEAETGSGQTQQKLSTKSDDSVADQTE